MKKAPLLLVVLSLVLIPPQLEAVTLQPGESIGIDFGAATSENSFNPCDPNTSGSLVNGSLGTLVDTAGQTVDNVGISFSGNTVLTNNLGTTQDFEHYSGFSLSNIQSAITGNSFTMTITGLSLTQRFTLDIVCAYSGQNLATEFIVNGIHILTDSTSTTGGTLAHFADLSPDANGTLTITTLGHNEAAGSAWVGVNAALLTVQAVPEPSTWALGILGGMALIMGFRRKSGLTA